LSLPAAAVLSTNAPKLSLRADGSEAGREDLAEVA
jgi:hypothetical protein